MAVMLSHVPMWCEADLCWRITILCSPLDFLLEAKEELVQAKVQEVGLVGATLLKKKTTSTAR